ncbi:MAG: hypothetical protein ACJ8AW_01965, partial [Rhodopila sp.]
ARRCTAGKPMFGVEAEAAGAFKTRLRVIRDGFTSILLGESLPTKPRERRRGAVLRLRRDHA